MNKFLSLFLSIIFPAFLQAQSAFTFTIHRLSPSSDITCLNPAVKFIVSSEDPDNVTYTWTGPSVNYSGVNADINAPGIYTVIASTAAFQSAQKTVTIGVDFSVPIVSLTPNLQSISCVNNLTTTVYVNTNITNTNHHFVSPSGGVSIINGANATYSVGSPGTYTHIAVNLKNGCSVSNSFTVTAAGFPSFSLQSTGNFSLGCGSKSVVAVNVNNVTTNPPGGTISYSLVNVASSNTLKTGTLSSATSFTMNTFGNYMVVTRDNLTNCESRIPFTIVQNNFEPDITLIVPTQTLDCKRSSMKISSHATSSNVVFDWSLAGNAFPGNTLTVNTKTSNPLIEFLGNYRLVTTDNTNFCKMDTVIPLFQNLHKPIALIALSHLNNLTCKQPSITLSNQSTSGIPFTSLFSATLPVKALVWKTPPLQATASNTPSFIACVPGIYTMQVMDENNGCKSSDSIIVFDAKVYPVVNNPSGPAPFCINPSKHSVAIYPLISGSTNSYTYQWSAPAQATINGINTLTLTANSLGIYTIVVTNTISGCKTEGQVIIANCLTGINENAFNNYYSVYPNPSSGVFSLDLEDGQGKKEIKVYNHLGQLIIVKDIEFSNQIIDLSDQPKGVYLLYVSSNSYQRNFTKLVKN